MKKILVIVCLLLMTVGLAIAQTGNSTGVTNYVPTVDVFGAHLNGGRGCAACHAPHNGGRSSGTYGSGTGAGIDGNDALWGTDVTPVMNTPFKTGPGGSAPFTIASTADWADPQFKHIGTCLSCHDGNLSKAPMMAGYSWEQAQGMLDFSGSGPAKLYGTANIPTLLGSDGSGAGNYENDHPVGPTATIGAVWSSYLTDGLTVKLPTSSTSSSVTLAITAGTVADDFNKDYGFPAVKALRVTPGEADPSKAYVVCTTCHQQHNMVAYRPANRGVAIAGYPTSDTTASFRTYFFVKGPYNPGAPYDKTHAPSTMQFCRQCHFSMSNEAAGTKTNIGTSF